MNCGLSEKSWDKYGACHGRFEPAEGISAAEPLAERAVKARAATPAKVAEPTRVQPAVATRATAILLT